MMAHVDFGTDHGCELIKDERVHGLSLTQTIKWGASIAQIIGYGATAFGWTPWNIYFFLIGLLGWFTVGVFWRDRAIMLIHVIALLAMIAGLLGS